MKAQAGFNALLPLSDFLPIPIRESVTPESQIVETATPQLIYRLSFEALVEFALRDLSNKLFVPRYAVEMPKKPELERFLKQLGEEIGDAG